MRKFHEKEIFFVFNHSLSRFYEVVRIL